VPLAGHQHQIAGPRELHGLRDSLPPIHDRHDPLPGVALGVRRDAAQDVVDDAARLLVARVVGGDDDDVAQPAGHRAHQRPFGAITIPSAAEHGDEPPLGQSSRRLEQVSKRVVCVGVVHDDRHVVGRSGNNLESPGNAVESGKPAFDSFERDSKSKRPLRSPQGCCKHSAGRRVLDAAWTTPCGV